MGRLFICLKLLLLIFLLMFSNSLKAQEVILLEDGGIVSSGAVPVRPTRDVVKTDDGVVVTYRFEEASIQKDSLFPECVNWRIEGFGTKYVYIQNKTVTGNQTFQADFIKIGTNVTETQPSGKVIFDKGKVTLLGNEIVIEPETTVEKGTEFNIITK